MANLVTTKELAALVGMKEATIRRYLFEARMPVRPMKMFDRTVWDISDPRLKAWITAAQERRRQERQEPGDH